VVDGIVQGVNFRASTRREALRLGLRGWVRNLPDGTVEVLADGDASRLEELLRWLHQGPRSARVTRVEVEWGAGDAAGDGFEVRY
jgi:acylphosphatase